MGYQSLYNLLLMVIMYASFHMAKQVGDYKDELEKDGWHYEMQVSFLEIYNETIRDLLRDDDSEMLKHEVKIGTDGRKYVSDLKLVPLDPKDSEGSERLNRSGATGDRAKEAMAINKSLSSLTDV